MEIHVFTFLGIMCNQRQLSGITFLILKGSSFHLPLRIESQILKGFKHVSDVVGT